MLVAIETADRTPRPTVWFTRKLFSNMKLKWEGEAIPLSPPMLAIAAAGDAADEPHAAANEAAGSTAEAHHAPHSPPFSPVRESTPERQPNKNGRTPSGPDDAPTTTADAAGRAEDPALLTSLSAKLDRCMGRIDLLETELGTSKKIMGGAILTLVSRVKKLERTLNTIESARLWVILPATEGLNRREARFLLGVRGQFIDVPGQSSHTFSFCAVSCYSSADVLSQAAVSASAWSFWCLAKGKAPMPTALDIPAEVYLAEDAQPGNTCHFVSEQRAKELDELLLRMTDTDWLTLMMQVGTNPALARELLGADVNEDNFIERMTAIKERKKRALAELRYRALKVIHPLALLYSGSAVPDTAGGTLGTTGTASTVPTSAAMDSPASHRELGISHFSSTKALPSPDSVTLPQILRVEYDDIGGYIPPIPYGALKIGRLCLPRFDLLLLRRRMNRYFRLNPDVDVGLDLWRDVNLLCQSLHSDDVEDFWRTQDEWVVSGWRLYPKSSVHAHSSTLILSGCCGCWTCYSDDSGWLCGNPMSGLASAPMRGFAKNPNAFTHIVLEHREASPRGYASVVPADSSSSIPADNVPAGSSSSIPADYVSAGHVLVSADRDRIC
ncbi:hypothetical protein Tco_0812927 [Tanacetum coccineum]